MIKNALVAPVETGALQKSFAVKVKQTRSKDWHVTVGANRKAGVRKSKKVTRSMFQFFQPPPSKQKRPTKRKPSRYLHLVNNGTSRGVAARLFMNRAAAMMGPASILAVKEKIVSEIVTHSSRS